MQKNNKGNVAIIAIVIILVVIAGFWFWNNKSSTYNSMQNNNPVPDITSNSNQGNMTNMPVSGNISDNTATNPADSSSTPSNQGNQVIIKNFAFSPTTLTVKTGTTVTWTNQDSTAHTVTGDKFNSGNLPSGNSFKFTFTSPGTYTYHCNIHPSMTGTVIVQN